MDAQLLLIRLTIAWALTGALVFTVIVTCASLVGLVKFSSPGQQNRLYQILIVQIVAISVTYFGNILPYSGQNVAQEVQKITNYEYWKTFEHKGVKAIAKSSDFPDEYRYSYADNGQQIEGKIKYVASINTYVESNKRGEYPAYYYYFRPVKADDQFIYVYDDMRAFSLKLPKRSGKSFFSGHGADGEFTPFHDVIVID